MQARNPVTSRIQKEKAKLINDGIIDLTEMTIPNIDIGIQRTLKILNVKNTDLKSFEKLQPQPNLHKVTVSNCPLSDFSGLTKQKGIKQIEFNNTPLSDQQNFRIAAIIALGSKLISINGSKVTNSERNIAREYPKVTKTLLEQGWVLQYPVPSQEDFDDICSKFHVKCKKADRELPQYQSPNKSQEQQSVSNIEGNTAEEEAPSFAEKVIDVLTPLGFPIRLGENMNKDIVDSVDTLMQLVTKVEGLENNE